MSDLARHTAAAGFLLPDFDLAGFNFRMTDFQGALGVVQMGRLNWILQKRAEWALRYDQALAGLAWLRTPTRPRTGIRSYQSYVCLFRPEDPTLANVPRLHKRRNTLMGRLQEAGIATRPGTHAVHMLGFYQRKYGLRPEDLPGAYLADRLSLSLPLYPQMTTTEQDYVIEHLLRLGAAV